MLQSSVSWTQVSLQLLFAVFCNQVTPSSLRFVQEPKKEAFKLKLPLGFPSAQNCQGRHNRHTRTSLVTCALLYIWSCELLPCQDVQFQFHFNLCPYAGRSQPGQAYWTVYKMINKSYTKTQHTKASLEHMLVSEMVVHEVIQDTPVRERV